MLFLLYITARLAAFVLIFVCLVGAIGRTRSTGPRSAFPAFAGAVVFLLLSGFLAIL